MTCKIVRERFPTPDAGGADKQNRFLRRRILLVGNLECRDFLFPSLARRFLGGEQRRRADEQKQDGTGPEQERTTMKSAHGVGRILCCPLAYFAGGT
jgi:hypothetical protein